MKAQRQTPLVHGSFPGTLEGTLRVATVTTPTPPTDFMPTLRAAGLRVTPQRRAILQVIEASDRPLSVEEIRQRLEAHGSGVPTIYRNLQCFVEKGWAEPILGPDQTMRFVRCRSGIHHHHLQCEACGRTVEVHTCEVEASLANLKELAGFKVTRHQLLLFGLCPNCQK